jgi:hypothetical protein
MLQSVSLNSGAPSPLFSAHRVTGLNLQDLNSPHEIDAIVRDLFKNIAHRLAVVGYYFPPTSHYSASVTTFMDALVADLGVRHSGIITTPSADKGSVDALSTLTAQAHNLPVLYVTTQEYAHEIKPEQFSDTVNLQKYKAVPKYMFANGDLYSQATARAATGLVVLGGRNDTVREFVNVIKEGKKAVVLVDDSFGPAYYPGKNRAENAGLYLKEQIESWGSPSLKHPAVGGINATFLTQYQEAIAQNVLFLNIRDQGAAGAAKKAAAFLKN